jgi:hypothetical protein
MPSYSIPVSAGLARDLTPVLALLFVVVNLITTNLSLPTSSVGYQFCLPAENKDGWNSCGIDPALLTEICTLERIPGDQVILDRRYGRRRRSFTYIFLESEDCSV